MNNPYTTLVHATCIAIDGIGVLLLGAPGSGKSDLALRLIDMPGTGVGGKILDTQLVADDQVILSRDHQMLIAKAPDTLKDLIEIRGLAITPVTSLEQIEVKLVVKLVPENEIERLPNPQQVFRTFLGLSVLEISLDPDAPSAPARLRAAVKTCVKAR